MSIREGINERLCNFCERGAECCDTRGKECDYLNEFYNFLKENNIVQKVEGEIEWPEYWAGDWYMDKNENKITLDDFIRQAGYRKVEEDPDKWREE